MSTCTVGHMLIHSPRQLLAAIPHLLHFQPADSIVCVGLDDSQIECLARFDIADAATCDMEPVLNGLRDATSPAYVVAVYRDAPVGLAELERVVTQLDPLPQLDLLHVSDGRWRSLLCQDDACCPPAGHSLDDAIEALTVSFIAAGSAPFGTREELAATLQGRRLSGDELLERDAAFTAPWAPWVMTRECLDRLVAMLVAPEALGWTDLATICRLLGDVRWRDALLRRVLEDASLRMPVRLALTDVIGRCPDVHVACAATTLAGLVWLDGNGSVARMAVDRALEADADYSLARLLDRALSAGIPPRVWIDSLSALTVDECLAA